MSTSVTVPTDVLNQIKAVHSDASPINFVVIGHAVNESGDYDFNTLAFQASGTGSISDIQTHLQPDQVQYVLYRTTTQVDLSKTVKFAFIYHLGSKVGFVKRGRFGVVKGDVVKNFEPYHVDFEIYAVDEISEEDVEKRIKSAAGTYNNVQEETIKSPTPIWKGSANNLTASRTSLLTDSTQNLSKPTVAKDSKLDISQDLSAAINAIRNKASENNWIVATYTNNDISKEVVVKKSGSNGFEGLKSELSEDAVCYALVRVVDEYEGIPTLKYAFITFVGEKVSIMKKAKISTHKGAIQKQFHPYHVEFNINTPSELTDAAILKEVQRISGSKAV